MDMKLPKLTVALPVYNHEKHDYDMVEAEVEVLTVHFKTRNMRVRVGNQVHAWATATGWSRTSASVVGRRSVYEHRNRHIAPGASARAHGAR